MQEPGTIIDDKYEILTAIDEGGMSKIYLARDKRLNKQWAVKEIKQTGDKVKDEVIVSSFITEANLMKQFDHPMFPRIVDILNQDDAIFVVMDFIEGQSLDKVVKEYGPQPQESVVEWGLQLCDALDYLHTREKTVVYRDMKPSNIMLRPDGSIAVIDFGTAREFRKEKVEGNLGDTTILGTRGYAAPEQFGGLGQTDARTDIYCLGATLYHLLTGKSPAEPPYEILPIRQVDPSLSPGLEMVIAKCTQQNPNLRYQSSAELFYALENYEKSDTGYVKKLKRKLAGFIVVLSLSVLCLLVGFTLMAAHAAVLDGDYNNKLLLAEAASNEETAARYYLDAIEILPEDYRAYYGLIDVYKLDNQFSLAEEKQFSEVMLAHLSQVKNDSSEYADLAFETGKLYWYYYVYAADAGDNQFTQIATAAPWFEDASGVSSFEEQQAAQVYRDIANFETSITAHINEGSDAGTYALLYENLVSLNEMAYEEHNDVMSLRVASLTFKALESYPRKFKADGQSESALRELFDKTVTLISKVDPASDDLDEIKFELISRQDAVEQVLEDTYASQKGV